MLELLINANPVAAMVIAAAATAAVCYWIAENFL